MAKQLLLRNAKLIGFPSAVTGGAAKDTVDIAINADGVVTAVGCMLPAEAGTQIIDLNGGWLSPGWIDLHTHIYYGVSNISLRADDIGPRTGVTALVDAGSAGQANYIGFREYIVKPSSFPIFAFINLGSIGLTFASQVSELDNLEKLDLDLMMACIEQNRSTIKGIKLRASGVIMRGMGIEIVRVAKRAADEVGLPLMIHVGEPLPLLEDILPELGAGDIVTHCYHGKRWGLFNRDGIIREALDARERGVLFDVGHGGASFSFDVAERAIALGFKPFSISTDLHARCVSGLVGDLPTTMSKLLSVGLTLEEVIQCVSDQPASVVGLERFSHGLVGCTARFTAFSLRHDGIRVRDSQRNERDLAAFISPEYAIIGPEAVRSGSNTVNQLHMDR